MALTLQNKGNEELLEAVTSYRRQYERQSDIVGTLDPTGQAKRSLLKSKIQEINQVLKKRGLKVKEVK